MEKLVKKFEQLIIKSFISIIKCYQRLISPILGSHCRFYPSCSEYSKEAFKTYGVIKGFYLSIKRLLKCHPLCKGGFDYIPKKETKVSKL